VYVIQLDQMRLAQCEALHAHSIAHLKKVLKNNTPYEVDYSVSDMGIVEMRMFSYSLIGLTLD